jgi:hypothetical protein
LLWVSSYWLYYFAVVAADDGPELHQRATVLSAPMTTKSTAGDIILSMPGDSALKRLCSVRALREQQAEPWLAATATPRIMQEFTRIRSRQSRLHLAGVPPILDLD